MAALSLLRGEVSSSRAEIAVTPRDRMAPVVKRSLAMRALLLAFTLLAACGHEIEKCPSSGISCSEPGAMCQFVEEGGGSAYCTCNGGTWTCNDCPEGAPPIGACDTGQSCNVWGFESSCACACTESGEWSCAKDDPSPNFHCSP